MEYLDQSLKDLFTDLHTSGLWADEKAISDSILLEPAEDILAAYTREKAQGTPDLMAFYKRHFRPVMADGDTYQTNPDHSPAEHLEAVWPYLSKPADNPDERSTRIPLPHPYVVVGGRFQEAYYWDSYFTMLGLIRSGRLEMVRNMLDNFAWSIDTFGHIPNGFRSYFLTRSQPPFFPSMVQDYARATGDAASVYARYLPQMEAEYRYFTESERTIGGLARYWDDANAPRIEMYGTDLEWLEHTKTHPDFFRDLRAACESGWDFSARWFTDPMDLGTIRTTKIWPVDLNCLLLKNEEILAEAATLVGTSDKSGEFYRAAAESRRSAIQSLFWDAEKGFFFDVLIADQSLFPRSTVAGLFPLYVGAATQEQAERAAEYMQAHLLRAGGLTTTDIPSGQQWDEPNGWAPHQWIAVQGLRRYGLNALADELAARWIATCDAVFNATGKFVEKYNVENPLQASSGGEYELQDGFGWSNGVYLDLLAKA